MRILDIYKNLNKKSVKWDNYFEVFETHLGKYVEKNPTVLEIGIADGGSLEMWSKYFINGEIHGIDAYDGVLQYKYDEPNVHVHVGDQSDPEYWKYFHQSNDLMFDVIIDDGSHVNKDQLLTLVQLFPRLKDGGTFIIEDTHTSYWEKWGGGLGRDDAFIQNSKGFIDFLHRQHINQEPPTMLQNVFKDLYSITYYNSLVVMTKRPYTDMKPYGSKDIGYGWK